MLTQKHTAAERTVHLKKAILRFVNYVQSVPSFCEQVCKPHQVTPARPLQQVHLNLDYVSNSVLQKLHQRMMIHQLAIPSKADTLRTCTGAGTKSFSITPAQEPCKEHNTTVQTLCSTCACNIAQQEQQIQSGRCTCKQRIQPHTNNTSLSTTRNCNATVTSSQPSVAVAPCCRASMPPPVARVC